MDDSEIPIGIGVKGKPLLEKPTKPELCYTKYEKTKKALADAVEVEGHLDRHEKSSGDEWQMSNLTEVASAMLNLDCTLYDFEHTNYLCQRSSVRKLGAWIHSAVTPDYFLNCCKANEELYQWYSNLNNHQSEDLYRLTKSVEDEYLRLKCLSPPGRLEEAEAWLDKFEGVMDKFHELETLNGAGTWPVDLQLALSLVMPGFDDIVGNVTHDQSRIWECAKKKIPPHRKENIIAHTSSAQTQGEGGMPTREVEDDKGALARILNSSRSASARERRAMSLIPVYGIESVGFILASAMPDHYQDVLPPSYTKGTRIPFESRRVLQFADCIRVHSELVDAFNSFISSDLAGLARRGYQGQIPVLRNEH
ncbi:hypothetical protein G7054_g171 [Neopestalotiopsis clavispora]|nr:hypothetical protein G7054_g171 [Neopestalotiopsis clavispora]